MKVIGAEIRFTYDRLPYPAREAKLVPLEIVFPAVIDDFTERVDSYCVPQAEVTFHTTDGDVTTLRVNLPFNPYDRSAPQVKGQEAAKQYLDRQIERGV